MMIVEMDVLEFKALEDKIAALQADKADLISKQKQVVILHKHFNGTVKIVSGVNADRYFTISGVRERQSYSPGYGRLGFSRDYDTIDVDLADAIRRGWLKIDLTENSTKTTKDYENMSEIVKDIHEEEKLNVRDALLSAQLRASQAEHYSVTVDDKCTKQIIDLKEVHNKQIENFEKVYQTKLEKHSIDFKEMVEFNKAKYDKLSQEFEDFKTDKKRLTLEQQLAEVIAELKAEKAKPWYRKIFK